MPEKSVDATSIPDLFAGLLPTRPAGVSRRAVIGAAWAAPVVIAAVTAPLAAASDATQPDAALFWSRPDGVQGQPSLLVLQVPDDSAGIGSTATIMVTVTDDAPLPQTISSDRWTWNPRVGPSTGVLVSPGEGLTAGTWSFTVEAWGELPAGYSATATYSNSVEPGSLTTTITVGSGPAPTLEWIPGTAAFGQTTTLRLTVPEDSYPIGVEAFLADAADIPNGPGTPPFPVGTTTVLPTGWSASTDPDSGLTVFQSGALARGAYDFEYTLGPGSAPVSPSVILGTAVGSPILCRLVIVAE